MAIPEQFQTYDESGTPLELVPRDIVHQVGHWHRAVNVFLFRSDGRLVVQRRSSSKDVCPGAWDLSVAEHVLPDEKDFEAAHRGLAEELSVYAVKLKPLGAELKGRFADLERGIKDNEFQQCFSGVSDDEITIDGLEVIDVAFCDLDKLQQKMGVMPELFTPWFIRLTSRIELFAQPFRG